MEWSDLHLFLAVVRSGSVRAAARALRIDPSTVSRRVAALEQAVGTRLFERTGEGLLLTASGQQMFQSSERVDGVIDELARRIAGHDRRLGGVVRITFPGSLAAMTHRAIAALVERHPALEVEMSGLDAPVAVDGRQADIAIRVADQPPEHLVGRRVAAVAGALYASRAYLEQRPEPLAAPSHSWVDWDRRISSKPAIAWVGQRFPDRRIAVRGLSTTDVLHAVLAGAGIGPLPCFVADTEPSLVRLVDAPSSVWSSVWLLTHRELRSVARVRVVLDHLAAALRREKDRIEGKPASKGRGSAARGGPSPRTTQEARPMPSQKARSSSAVRTRRAGGRPASRARP
jgi:DNA-binding transcriptional LysR family regulator